MNISELTQGIESIKSTVIVDKEQATNKYEKAYRVVFLDTCFVSHCSRTEEISMISTEALKLSFQGEKVVFVITSTILYELQGHPSVAVPEHVQKFFEMLKNDGLDVIYMSEEDIIAAIDGVVEKEDNEKNALFVSIYKGLIQCIRTLSDILQGSIYKNVAFNNGEIPDTSTFIQSYFEYCRDKKEVKDSLGENLIAHLILYHLKTLNFDKRQVTFLTDDITSIGSMGVTELKRYKEKQSYTCINTVTLLSNLNSNINVLFKDKTKLSEHLKIIRQNFKNVCLITGKFDPTCYDTITPEDLAELLWNGQKICYPAIF